MNKIKLKKMSSLKATPDHPTLGRGVSSQLYEGKPAVPGVEGGQHGQPFRAGAPSKSRSQAGPEANPTTYQL